MRELRRIWGKRAVEESRKGEEGLLASLLWLDFFLQRWIMFLAASGHCRFLLSIVVNSQSHCMQEEIFNEKGAKKKLFCSLSLSKIIVRITIYSLQFYKCPINLKNWYIQFYMCLSFIVYFAHNRFYTWKNCKIEK